jgi:hypothetical protein
VETFSREVDVVLRSIFPEADDVEL